MSQLTAQPASDTSKDAGLYEAWPDGNYDTDTYLINGRDASSHTYNVIIQFDISSIPSGSTIDSATLTMYLETNTDGAGARTYDIHRVTRAWTLTEATWNSYSTGNTWTTAGGDYDATYDATGSVNAVGSYNFTVTSLVQEWVDGTTNAGLIIKDRTLTNTTRKEWTSSEGAVEANRPKLVVNYTEPPSANFFAVL